MKTVVIMGAGQVGGIVLDLLNFNRMQVAAFGDNNPDIWNRDAEIPILPVPEALMTNPNLVLISVLGEERITQFRSQLLELGYRGEVMALGELYGSFDIRGATLKRIARRIEETGIDGALAELGVYRGDLAWQINKLFPERRLYLFDTFEGFHQQDIVEEQKLGSSRAKTGDFGDTHEEYVLSRMPFKENVTVCKGRFPETAQGLEDQFALVSIDVDLHAPTLAGLEYFYPRLSPGGVILLHDYNSCRFDGVKKALLDYEQRHSKLPVIPLSDLHGTAVIINGFVTEKG